MPSQYPGTTVELESALPASGLPTTWKAAADEIAQQHKENNDAQTTRMSPRSPAASGTRPALASFYADDHRSP